MDTKTWGKEIRDNLQERPVEWQGAPCWPLSYGSASWIRTSDRPINSRMLYR